MTPLSYLLTPWRGSILNGNQRLTYFDGSPSKSKEVELSGVKNDQEKVRLDLLPPGPLYQIAQVLTFGARKYAEYNWAKGLHYNRLYRAMLGHIWAWWTGEDLDQETGLSHLAHAGCCLLFIMDQTLRSKAEFDNRPLGQIAGLNGRHQDLA